MSSGIDGSGLGGPLLINKIYEMVRELCHETERENRDTARLDAQQELAAGLAGAHDMHEAADSTRTGAVVSGITLAVTAGAETYFAVGTMSADKKTAEDAATALKLTSTGEKLADLLHQGYEAAAKDHEADAQTQAALGKAAGHEADQAKDLVQQGRQLESSMTESYREILRSQHDCVMTALAKRC